MKNGDLIRRGNGTLERRKGVYIAHLRGTDAEMGWQHAALAMEACGDVVASYFNDVVASLMAHRYPAFATTANRFLKWLFYTLNKHNIGRPVTDHIRGMAEASGMSFTETAKAILVPDIIHFLIGKTFPGFIPVAPSCSGFVASRTATEGGKLIVGRNFDFFGQGVWDTNNALIFMTPENGQRFCWIGALGAPASGQGLNESGLIVSIYTKFNKDVRLTGIPLFTMVTKILQTCERLEDVVKLIAETPRICGLSLLAVDAKAGDAVVVGFSANHVETVVPERDVLVRTNHYVTSDMKRFQVAPYPWLLHSTSRFNRLHALLEAKRGHLKPSDVPAMLADDVDFYERRRRLAGYIVRACNNSQSVVFSPHDDALWLGNDPFPVCASRTFVGFRMSAAFNGDRDHYDIEDLPGADGLSSLEREAHGHFQAAWAAHLDYHRDDFAIQHLRQAEEAAPHEPVFPRLAGLLLMKQGKHVQALPFMERNALYDYAHDIMKAEAHLWYGRCLDLAGMRTVAVAQYEQAAALAVSPISGAAVRHLRVPFKNRHLADVSPEFVVGTAIARY